MFETLKCWWYGHEPSTEIVLDFPLGWVPESHKYKGSVCMERATCDRCGAYIGSEPVLATEERVNEYLEGFGVRADQEHCK